jgi:flagellin
MPLRIVSALSSMRLSSQQLGAPLNQQRTFERLSSGQRITGNPADVAISTALRRDIRVATVALTNASVGVAMTSIADDALSEISSLLGRMYDLASYSASTTILSNEDRSVLQREFSAVAGQIQEIANTTTYNGINLLSANSNIVIQVGIDASASSGITFSGIQGSLEAIGLANSATGALSYSVNTQAASRSAEAMVRAAIDEIENRRSVFTSMEDRLQVSIANLSSAREGISAAENGIKEAGDTAEKTRSDIIKDAGASLLAQANQQPLSVAKLLEGSSSGESNSKDSFAISAPASAGLSSGGTLSKDSDSQVLAKLREDLKKI